MVQNDSGTPANRTAIEHDLFCPECGYNLRGLTSENCPECGYGLDWVKLSEPQIPWVRRKEIGRFRAYWKTVWFVLFRNRRFCQEIARPVSYRDSQSFRWVTILHVYLPCLLFTMASYVLSYNIKPTYLFDDQLLDELHAMVWPVAVLQAFLLLFLAGVTGVQSYFFHPKHLPVEHQNRAVALSYYASAPLALAPFAFISSPLLFYCGEFSSYRLGEIILANIGAIVPAIPVTAWLLLLIRLATKPLQRQEGSLWLFGFGLPFLWLALAVLCFVVLSVIVFYVVAVFVSLS